MDYLVAGPFGVGPFGFGVIQMLAFLAFRLLGCWASWLLGYWSCLAVYVTAVLLCNSDFRLFVCRVIRFRAIWLFEYKAAWLFGYWVTKLLVCWPVGLLGCCFPVGHARQLKRSSFVLFGIKFIASLY